jgi:hypothetical protein
MSRVKREKTYVRIDDKSGAPSESGGALSDADLGQQAWRHRGVTVPA